MGVALKPEDNFRVPEESYGFDNKRMAWETIAPPLDRASPLRTSHLRDPVGPQIHFASESFMDEMAAAIERRSDRVPAAACEERARHRGDQGGGGESRLAAAHLAAASDQSGNKVTGRGIAYAQRSGTRVAIVAEVEVDRSDRQDLGAQVHRRA